MLPPSQTSKYLKPPLTVSTFETEAEAVERANDCEFGLAGAVISADQERCQRVAEALECGIVWINCSQPCFCQVGCGFGGAGARFGGLEDAMARSAGGEGGRQGGRMGQSY